MQDKVNIAVFVDYDNIEIGVKSTLHREFDVAVALDALKERGDIVAKFAYANWSRQELATRQMAENAIQMVQRVPSPRGDKNGADINLALDALEMAFTHDHVNAFAIVSGDSDFMPLVKRALQVLERRAVQPQLGLLKSTMLQLDPAFSERAYGCGSFSEFVERLKKADYINVSGTGGRYIIERKATTAIETPEPEEAIPLLRDVLELHRLEMEEGSNADTLLDWMKTENPDFDPARYGFQQFAEF